MNRLCQFSPKFEHHVTCNDAIFVAKHESYFVRPLPPVICWLVAQSVNLMDPFLNRLWSIQLPDYMNYQENDDIDVFFSGQLEKKNTQPLSRNDRSIINKCFQVLIV